VDNTRTIDEAAGTKIDQIFLGTCTNSRIEDWEVVARIVKGKKKADNIRFLVVPGSEDVMKESIAKGYYQTLIDFGATMITPGCGPCVGIHEGVPADGEACLSTQNRNFQGRLGNPESSIYLGSPAVIAASAIAGVIADPRKYVKELKSIGRPQLVDTEALKMVAHSAQKTVERTVKDTAAVLGPKAKETSDKVEKIARDAIAKYGPQAHKAALEVEKTVSKMALDAAQALREALKPKVAQPKAKAAKTASRAKKKRRPGKQPRSRR
jgi:aconitase A